MLFFFFFRACAAVKVTLAAQNANLVVTIEDHGGGIPLHIRDRVFDYAFTTAKPRQPHSLSGASSGTMSFALHRSGSSSSSSGGSSGGSPSNLNLVSGGGSGHPASGPTLAGFGYGLPIARLYARYLGGELDLEHAEDGTVAKVQLDPVGDGLEML
jgi:signal transduction histidine kinase